MRRTAFVIAAPILWMAVIFAGSSVPGKHPPRTQHHLDKIAHFTEYAILGWLSQRALQRAGLGPRSSVVVAALVGSAYGASDEWHQSFVHWRDVEVLDWVADTIGATTGAWVAARFSVRATLEGRSRPASR